MIEVIFECYARGNEYEEEMEFEDDATDDEIEAEWKEWVWNLIGGDYGWRKV